MRLTPRLAGGFYVRCTEPIGDTDPSEPCMGDTFWIVKLPDGRIVVECEQCNERHDLRVVFDAREEST